MVQCKSSSRYHHHQTTAIQWQSPPPTFLLLLSLLLTIFYKLPTSLAYQQQRQHHQHEAKPFLFRCIEINDTTTLPISPISILLLTLLTFLLFNFIFCADAGPSTALTSHILLEVKSPNDDNSTLQNLQNIKSEIQNNPAKFGKFAQLYSKCPSGKQAKGSLGWINQGDMVPPFDKVVFDERNKENVVLGPVKTQFGYHLIWIHERVIRT